MNGKLKALNKPTESRLAISNVLAMVAGVTFVISALMASPILIDCAIYVILAAIYVKMK